MTHIDNGNFISSRWTHFRALTYLQVMRDAEDEIQVNSWDADDNTEGILRIAVFSLLALSFSLIAYFTVQIVRNTREFQEHISTRILMPAVSIYMTLECATLAVDEASRTIPVGWAMLLYAVEAFVVPALLLSTFLVTFLAYRIRSIPFCCVRRRLHREEEEDSDCPQRIAAKSKSADLLVQPKLLILGMHLLSMGLWIVGLLVNFDVMWSDSTLAGRTGWTTIAFESWTPSSIHVILALLPLALLCFFCLYFAGLLFRYGNDLSLTIYSSFFNPWMWPLIGVIAMFAGTFPSYPWFPVSCNLGICIYQLTMLRVSFEIRQDLRQATDLGSYLCACWEVPLAVGDATAVEQVLVDEHPEKDRSGFLKQSKSSKKGISSGVGLVVCGVAVACVVQCAYRISE